MQLAGTLFGSYPISAAVEETQELIVLSFLDNMWALNEDLQHIECALGPSLRKGLNDIRQEGIVSANQS